VKKQFTRLAVVAAVGFIAVSGALAASASAGAPAPSTDGKERASVGEVLAKLGKTKPGVAQQRSADVGTAAATTILVENHNSGKCFDVVNGSTANGVDVQQYDCLAVPQQLLNVLSPESEWTQLQFQHSGKCLDVRGGGLSNGTQLQQWDCAPGAAAQQFTVFSQTNGSIALVSRTAWEGNLLRPKCVDVRGGSFDNGAKIQQWSCATTSDENEDVASAEQFNTYLVS
jgi:hypothetical protein